MSFWISIVGGLLIMMRQHARSEALFYYFRLEDQVPENHLLRLIEKLNGAVKNFIGRDGGLCPALRTSFCGDLLYVKLFWSRQSQNHENPNGGKRRDSNPRPRKNVTSGWSLALIGNPSAQKFPGRRTGPEAFR